jgi:hypothetical protein
MKWEGRDPGVHQCPAVHPVSGGVRRETVTRLEVTSRRSERALPKTTDLPGLNLRSKEAWSTWSGDLAKPHVSDTGSDSEILEGGEARDPVAEIRQRLEAIERYRKPGFEAARDEAIDGLSEYVAERLDNLVLSEVLSAAHPVAADGIAYDAELTAEFGQALHHALIGEPATKILSALQVPADDLVSSIMEAMPIKIIDHELGNIKTWIEVGGAAIGIITGNLHMAWACLKELVHDVIHRAVKEGVKTLLSGGSRETGTRRATSPADKVVVAPGFWSPEHATAITTLKAGRPFAWEATQPKPQENRARAGEPTEGNPRTAETDTAAEPSPADVKRAAPMTERSSQGNAAGGRDTAAGARRGVTGTSTQTPSARKGHPQQAALIREGREGASLARAQAASGAALASPVPPVVQATTAFIRLDIYYQPTLTGSFAVGDQAAHPAVLFVERNSSCGAPDEPQPVTTLVTGNDRPRGAITGQQDSAMPSIRWEQWAAAGSRGFAAGSPSADALRHRLRSILTGEQADLQTRAMTVTRLPTRPDLEASSWRCLVIMATFSDGQGRATLQGAAIRTQVFDEFTCIVASAVSGVIPV